MAEALKEGRDAVAAASRVVFFTGAGLGAESGIPTFRGESGLWRGFRAEELATPQAFAADPQQVWEWYQWRRGLIRDCAPHAGHVAIGEFVGSGGRNSAVVTQNVDGMHQRSGVADVIELHGNIWKNRCRSCDAEELIDDSADAQLAESPPVCGCGALMGPGVVWFGEGLPAAAWRRAEMACRDADVIVVVGTSAVVQPAASLVGVAAHAGARVIEVNPDPAGLGGDVIVIAATAANALPELLAPPQ